MTNPQQTLILNGENLKAFPLKSGTRQECPLPPLLFNIALEVLAAEIREEKEIKGIQIARRNINNLRYIDENTLMTEGKEELNSLLMRVKEEHEKAGLKLNIQKTKIMVSGHMTSWQIDVGENANNDRLYFQTYFQNHCRW